MFKKLKLKEKKKEKKNSTELQKPNIEAGGYNNKKCDWGKKKREKKKKLKSLIRFHSVNKIDYNRGVEKGKKKKEEKIQKNIQNKSKHNKNKCFTFAIAIRVLSLTVSHGPPHLLYHCADLWACCGGSSDSNLVLLLCVLASNVYSYQNECAFFCGGSQWPFIYFIDTECLVDCVNLI